MFDESRWARWYDGETGWWSVPLEWKVLLMYCPHAIHPYDWPNELIHPPITHATGYRGGRR